MKADGNVKHNKYNSMHKKCESGCTDVYVGNNVVV